MYIHKCEYLHKNIILNNLFKTKSLHIFFRVFTLTLYFYLRVVVDLVVVEKLLTRLCISINSLNMQFSPSPSSGRSDQEELYIFLLLSKRCC